MQPEYRGYQNQKALAEALAGKIGQLLSQGMEQKGSATLAVSGGRTPAPLFGILSSLDIPWKNVTITLVDERMVEVTSPDSNEYLVRKHLLQDKAGKATFVGLKSECRDAEKAQAECQQRLQTVPRPFDVLVLGMGNDGHIASLFPGAPQLQEAIKPECKQLCMTITPPDAPHTRLSMTLPTILDAKQIVLHIVGHEKKVIFEAALAGGAKTQMPIRYVINQNKTPVAVYWAP